MVLAVQFAEETEQMTSNRYRPNGRGNARMRQRQLLLALGIAAGLALLVTGALVVFGRPQPASAQRQLAELTDASPGRIPAGVSVPAHRREADHRIAANPRPISNEEGAVEDSSQLNRDDTRREAGEPEQTRADLPASENVDPQNPRSLLRHARRQVRNGRMQGVLETSRQIASVVSDDAGRSKIEAKVRDMEAAAAAGQLVDFDSLITLIEQVIAPTTWSSVGGAGTIQSFPGGVYI